MKKFLNDLCSNDDNFKKLAESIIYYLRDEFPMILNNKI